MDAPNPYQAPACDPSALVDPDGPPDREWRRRISWAVAFALNMIVPGMVGWNMLAPRGRWGMAFAAAVLFALGSLALRHARGWAGPMAAGAYLVAASQVVPILQFMAGMVGLRTAARLGLTSPDDEAAAFLITLVAGGLLLAISAALGLVFGLVFGTNRRDRDQPRRVRRVGEDAP